MPDAAAPGSGRSAAPGGEGAADTVRPEPEAPDYRSTFALDVDTASYGYARRTLGDGLSSRRPGTSGPRSSSTASARGTSGRRGPASR